MLIHLTSRRQKEACQTLYIIEYFFSIDLNNEFKKIFTQALDKDNSGSINSDELSKLGGNMSKEKIEALMAKLDKDGDGKITLEEFRGLFKQIK